MVSVEIVYTRGLRLYSYVLKVKPKGSISIYGTTSYIYKINRYGRIVHGIFIDFAIFAKFSSPMN